MNGYDYKITYLHHVMSTAFVRIKDDAILFTSSDEKLVKAFADGFVCGSGRTKKYYIE